MRLSWLAAVGNIINHDVLGRFYGDKCVDYRALKETIAKTCKHIQRTRDLDGFGGLCRKKQIRARNVVWTLFLGIVVVAI